MADALEYAHRQGVVHRDIKPENILLAEGGALVADFGIARALDAAAGERLTETGLALGTPAYMSPEQAAGSRRVDGRADIYALGCVLYEMLAGQPPFTGPTTQAVLARHAMDPVPSLRTVRATVSPRLARVVERALAKVPADRFPTARALAEALAIPDPTWTQQAVTAVTPARASARRWVPLVAAVALLAALGVAVATRARSSNRAPVSVDPTLVAVAPFRVAAADSSLAYLRDGIVDLMATKLSGTLAFRPADARAMQTTWRRAADRGGDVSEQEALRLAAGLGAGRLVEGEMVSSGRRLAISAALVDAPGGRVRARAAVEGPSDSLTGLLDQIAAQLLALGAGEPEQRLASLAATSPTGLRAYIDGRLLLRRNDYAGAMKRFQAALAADSGFALAALGLVRAGTETMGDPAASRAAWRLRDRLSPADRAQLDVLLGAEYPREPHGVEQLQAAERFTQLAPDDPEAWDLYGAQLCCLGPLLGVPDAQARAKSAFGRALALDSGFTLSANGFTGMAATLGDTADMRRGLALVLRGDSTSPASVALQWHVATVLGDTAAAGRLARSDSMVSMRADGWQQSGPWATLNVFLQQGLGNRDLDLVFQRSLDVAPTDDQRWSIKDLGYRLAVIRGRATGLPLPPRVCCEREQILRVMDALFSDADPALAVAAGAALEREVGRPLRGDWIRGRFAAAEYALRAGRLAVARRAAADIRAGRANGPDAAADAAAGRAYALIDRGAARGAERAALRRRAGWRSSIRCSPTCPTAGEDPAVRQSDRRPAARAARRVRTRARGHPAAGLDPQLFGARDVSPGGGPDRRRGRRHRRGHPCLPSLSRHPRDAEPRLQLEVRRVRAELAMLERRR